MNILSIYRLADLPRIAALSFLLFLSTQLTLAYLSFDGNASVFWIPCGLGLAILLIKGQKYWPALFISALASDLYRGTPALASLIIAITIVLEALLIAALLNKLRIKNTSFSPLLCHSRDYIYLLLIAAPCALLGAFSGAGTLWLNGLIGQQQLFSSMLNWWLGDVLGIATICPLLLVWQQRASMWHQRKIEASLCFGLAFLLGQIVFAGWWHQSLGHIAQSFWAFLFVIWAATRFGRHGSLLLVVMTTTQALFGALHGIGFFAADLAQHRFLNVWLYAMVLNLVGVLLALLINERKHAEALAQESEQRHRTLVEWSPEAIAVHRHGTLIYMNPAAIALAGARDAQALIGQSLLNLVHPDYHQTVQNRTRLISEGGVAERMIEIKLIRPDGVVVDIEVQSTLITLDGKPAIHALIRDITQRKQASQYEQFRNRTLEVLASGAPLLQQLTTLALGVEQLYPAIKCSILLLDQEGQHLRHGAAPSLPDFYNEAIDGVAIGIGVGACGTAAFTGQRVITADIATHPFWDQYKQLAADAGLASCWSQPIIASNHQVLGTFAIYHAIVHSPNPHDIRIIEQSAHLASIAIERNIVAEKLSASEAHYRLLTENVSDVAWRQDINNNYTYISPADEILRGYPSHEVVGLHIFEHLTPEGIAFIKQKRKQRLQEENRGIQTGPYTLEIQQRCKDGRLIWTEILSTPERDAQGQITGYYGITRDITQRKQDEAELRIAAIAFQSQEGMFVTDVDWHILRVNHAFTTITGYSPQDALGQTPIMLTSLRHKAAFYSGMTHHIRQKGTWQGEIWNKRKNGEIFPAWLILTEVKAENGEVTHYVATLTDITSRKAAEEQIQSLAFYDPLTALPNRRLLMDRLAQAMTLGARHESKGALLFIDLDNFKILNDTLGHDTGDLLLVEVAKRLSASTRQGDTVARLGGDEFVVMLEDLSVNALEAATEAEAVGEKILSTLNQIYQLAGYSHHSTPSVGITLFGEQAESIDEPLKRADLAMYQAKAAGRNTLRFFDPQMQADVTHRVALEAGLREALESQQFMLFYQAQVKGTGQLTGAEALVRWRHPQQGMISPTKFIPLAEESGLILALGNWVLSAACKQLARWASSPEMSHLTIAVNVSPRQFHQADFVEQVLNILARTGASAQQLKLELTESVLIANVEDVILKMSILKQQGVGFSIDDFGTGYSSLSYLKRLPLDQLKIDQSFIRDILTDTNDAAIAKMVIVLADSLGLSVIAEGVETEAQRDFLASQGCQSYQGYLYSRPLPLHEFEAYALSELIET
ncbi:EAL domain-containing protein [Iodobacter sp. HSC-16F04]|uniref:EAL domain-containing protein n=1 Tax=Iodobacter violaceini TaxID=3044271 RepID=A0ABX0KST6_9NEIS|nr:EAL domain-containing protein [Iodobacter violacea]NHQ87710.1 EAL domain-containing protein [Iodobacter violacea]